MAAVLALLLCLLTPCGGLERIFQTSEITIPRRLLPKVDDSTDSLLYAITFGVEKHFIYLEKQSFIPADFRLYLNGRLHTSPRDLQPLKSDCYYQGYVLDSPSSAATLMACNGLRGLVEFYNVSYVIEPFLFMHDFKHLLHRLSIMGKDDLLFTDSDTDPLSNRTVQQHIASHGHAARPVGQMLRFIEMAMFVTKDLYDSFGSSLSTITNNMVLLVSYLNTRFIPLDIRIFMVSLDVWTDSDQVDLVNGTTSKKLDRFLAWIHWNWPKPISYDIPVLFSYDSSMGRGLTFFGGMCSQRNGALIVYPRDQGIDKFSVLVAHMLGHNIGLMHDNSRDCQCSGSACIMNTNIGNVFGAATFSSCSIADFAKFISAFGATCILKEPVVRVPFNPRICGNKILDDGEDCDCGTAVECSADPCCESNCKLKEDAQCAWGACCTNCQVLPEGTLCREADDECDLSEYCNGISNVCPDDFFQQNGNACSDHKWHCYKGTCRNPDSQCKKLFGGGSHAADTLCFVQANVQHDRFGNCGSDVKGSYFGCTAEHAMCGKLQCAYMNRLPLMSAKAPIIYYSPKSSICMSIDVSRNSDFRDTAFVLDGTKCGDDKICVKHKCVQISTLEKSCSEDSTCSGHGLCNNKGNCHCFPGWAPPTCIGSGTGGSIDSGSPRVEFESENDDSDYPLIIGLSIGLPLLFVIIVTVLIKSGTFKCARKSETYESDSEGRANSTTRNSPASSYRSV
ncbi:disintegrin and metalloproteinase domain-containing protein 9-like [Ambystoma mexicanum]|uniref:disintegrin and metalloproteinase domain-containing protein 9-like n=1 Tax=Ambystoma mexicanum TaxID=8296 RepID=UPI0037E83D1E